MIGSLEQPLRDEVKAAFADSLRVCWETLTGIAGLGLLVSLVMKGLPLHTQMDKRWGVEDGDAGNGTSVVDGSSAGSRSGE